MKEKPTNPEYSLPAELVHGADQLAGEIDELILKSRGHIEILRKDLEEVTGDAGFTEEHGISDTEVAEIRKYIAIAEENLKDLEESKKDILENAREAEQLHGDISKFLEEHRFGKENLTWIASMDNRKHIHHSGRHFGFSYPTSFWQRMHAAFAPFIVIIIVFIVLGIFSVFPFIPSSVSFTTIGEALLATFLRLLIAYVLAIICSIPLALAVTKSPFMERLLLPIFDIAQSVPVLAFFPIIIIFFIHFGFTNGAAIFIIFLSMLWNIVFSLVGGLNVIPSDIKSAAHVFGIRGVDFIRTILLPAVIPYIITGSLLAWAQGWNIIIVAEVLHTYIPGGTARNDLFGIGSTLVNATANSQNSVFVVAILAMILLIAFLNFFVWQKLLHYAERYKFE